MVDMNNKINVFKISTYTLIVISVGFIVFCIANILDYLVTMQYTVNSHLGSNIQYPIADREVEIRFLIKCFIGVIIYSFLVIVFLIRNFKSNKR